GVTVRCAALLPFSIEPVVEQVVTGVLLDDTRGTMVDREAGRPLAYMTQRSRLDAFLVERAQEAGVEFRDGHAAREIIEAADGTFRVRVEHGDVHTSRVLIGADGANGVVGTALGFGHAGELAVALEGNLPCPDGLPAFIRGRLALSLALLPGGYGWLFPKGDHINVGVGGWKTVSGPVLRATLDAYTRSWGWEPAALIGVRGHHLPMLRAGAVLAARGVALVGDAAGLVDPLSGEGITSAVTSGVAVAPAVDDYLSGAARDLAGYQCTLERELLPELVASRGLMEVFHAWPRPITWVALRSGRAWRAMARLASGDRTYHGIVRRTGPLAPTLAPLAAVARHVSTARFGAR
ncbi:MAG: NAD(P)/FAD-dependent oxidoreductase, partial [Dehalococcoidia bacterium]|nr:NAD(P)/FAD-dependent oxidoreductase [Dehalococcoidia bacterium]